MKRPLLLALAGIAGAAAGCLLLQPINATMLRVALLVSLGVFTVALLLLVWRSKFQRRVVIAVISLGLCAVLLAALLPGRPADAVSLRNRYVKALGNYTGVSYVWGGEGKMGIDCSGLPRRAFCDALLGEGFRTGNASLVREAVSQWWYDASARAMAEGYRGYLVPLFPTNALRTTDFSKLEPGDLAITRSGIHCLVYVGGDTWIQADPSVGKVATFNARTTNNSWFADPMNLYRWSLLE
jgi:hypothetical protein